MALEDRIRSSVETALVELTARLDHELRAIVAELVTVATEDCNEAVAAIQRDTAEQVTADTQRQIEAAEARLRVTMDEVLNEARNDERSKAASEMQHLVDAGMAGLTRVLESVRGLDGAMSLSEVLDVLGQSAGREVSRAAVLVVRNERLMGWRLQGFGDKDAQPKTIDLGLDECGVLGLAVATARPATTRHGDGAPAGPGFVPLPADRMGLAVPVIVGGRAVAVVYADSVTADGRAHAVPSGWPEVIELLARHAARCLEALTIQKTASPQSPRFWVPGAMRSNAASDRIAAKRVTETSSPRAVAPPGVLT